MGLLSGIVAGAASIFGAKQQAKEQSRIADRQMAFQERMSNTAYQRSMADMRSAGLNPMLAFSSGGASTPSGATYSPPNIMERAVSSALDTVRVKKELREADSRISVNESLKLLQDAQRRMNESSAKKNDVETRRSAAELPFLEGRAEADKKTSQGVKSLGSLIRWLNPFKGLFK